MKETACQKPARISKIPRTFLNAVLNHVWDCGKGFWRGRGMEGGDGRGKKSRLLELH